MHTFTTRPLNAAFTSWSAPAQLDLPAGSVSNEFYAWKDGPTFHGMYVDFNSFGRWIHVTAGSVTGPWTNPEIMGFNAQEGAMMLRRPSGGWRFFYEPGDAGVPTGTYRYADAATSFTSFSNLQSVTSTIPMRNGKMTLVEQTETYADWAAARLASRPVAERAPFGDPDGDGISNILEAALNQSPLAPDAGKVLSMVLVDDGSGGHTLVARFTRVRAIAGVLATLEVSPDLSSWVPGPPPTSLTMQTDGTEVVEVRIPANGAKYIRLTTPLP
jgi:hypothetical protein